MGRFDTKAIQITVDVPGFDLERSTKLFRDRAARRAAWMQKQNQPKPVQGPLSKPPSHPPVAEPPAPVVFGNPDANQDSATGPAAVDFYMEL